MVMMVCVMVELTLKASLNEDCAKRALHTRRCPMQLTVMVDVEMFPLN